jgi:hypothetical protein
LDALVGSLSVYMIIGIIVVVGVSQFNRIAGSILGIAFWCAVAVVGGTAYDKGGGIQLLELEFTRSGFYFFCGAFVAFNAFNLVMALRRRRRFLSRRSSITSDED